MSKPQPSIFGIKRLASDTLLYGVFHALVRALNFITFPLLARHFSVADYGRFDFAMVTVNLIALLCIFGQDSALARYYYDVKKEHEKQAVVSQSLFIQIGFLTVFFICFLALYNSVIFDRLHSTFSSKELLILACQVPVYVLLNFTQNILKWSFQRFKFIALSAGVVMSIMCLALFGTLIFDFDMFQFFVGYLVIITFFALLGLWFVRNLLTFSWSSAYIQPLIVFGAPMGIIAVAMSFSPTLERSLLLLQANPEMLGYYSVAAKMAMIMTILLNAFQTAFGPFAYAILEKENVEKFYAQILRLFLFIFGFACLLLIAVQPHLVLWLVDERYLPAIWIAPVLIMAMFIEGICGVVELNISLAKKSYLLIGPALLYFLVLLIVFFSFSKMMGITALIAGILAGQLVKLIAITIISNRLYIGQWSYRTLGYHLFYMLSALLIFLQFKQFNIIHAELVMIAIALFYLPFWFTVGLHREDRHMISRRALMLKEAVFGR